MCVVAVESMRILDNFQGKYCIFIFIILFYFESFYFQIFVQKTFNLNLIYFLNLIFIFYFNC